MSNLFVNMFESLKGETVKIVLKSGVQMHGALEAVDQFLNVKIVNVSLVDDDVSVSLTNCFVRGSVIRQIDLSDTNLEFTELEIATKKMHGQQT